MAQPEDHDVFDSAPANAKTWRVAHLSDIHIVGEPYGFRIECGRSGPRGNVRLQRVFDELQRIHESEPLDFVLISGDITDAGLSSEWAEFLDKLAPYKDLMDRVVILPGNHDLNIVDRTNPARLDLPTSPKKRLRQIRALSTIEALQGSKVQVVDEKQSRPGGWLSEALAPHADTIARFSNRGSVRLSWQIGDLWATSFPMILPPKEPDGLGIILLNSNVEAHFSFTNALGMMSVAQTRAIETTVKLHPNAVWIVALHHHLVEYPSRVKALSDRIGTALVNGSWFVRRLQRIADRVVVMHGHRHVDWIGHCGGLRIISAPSPVMDAGDGKPTHFYVHTLAATSSGKLLLLKPKRIDVSDAEPEPPSKPTARQKRRISQPTS